MNHTYPGAKWIMLAGGLMTASAASEAAVITTTFNDVVLDNMSKFLVFNVVERTAGIQDSKNSSGGGTFNIYIDRVKPYISGGAADGIMSEFGSPIQALRLDEGDIVGPSDPSFRYDSAPRIQNWTSDNPTGYLGLMFKVDGETHYGWALITETGTDQYELHSVAYEDIAGQSITIGAVPEPSSIALMALSAGSVAAFELRRRRRKSREAVAGKAAA
ncbi:MAG TPA: PEP-CTERM sorting domain-containing protein [Chthoniobacteraceae bacterium]|nr:PEP-CTERM sorting domain-containing protein [Chthoniobacteraceae bacterium]